MQVLLDALSNMFSHSPVGIDHQQGKFVAAITCGQICRPAMFLHDRRKPAKRTVPRQVALKIIDAFELVQIQKQKRKRVMTAVGAAHFRLERSEEHTSELQSLTNLVCRLLLEKKKKEI